MRICSGCGLTIKDDDLLNCSLCGTRLPLTSSGNIVNETASFNNRPPMRSPVKFYLLYPVGMIILAFGFWEIYTQIGAHSSLSTINIENLSFIGYGIAGIVVLLLASLVYYYYLYLNFSDINLLTVNTHPPDTRPQPVQPFIPILLLFVFSLATYWIKYDFLYLHIKENHPEVQKKPLHPALVIFSIIAATVIIAIIFIVAIVLMVANNTSNLEISETDVILSNTVFLFSAIGIGAIAVCNIVVRLLFDIKWQNQLNQHIQHHFD